MIYQQYTTELPSALLGPRSKKKKKIHAEKNSLYFSKWNFLTLILKNFKEQKPPQKNFYTLANGTF